MKLPAHWAPTGWRASADGGRIIEYSCYLPGGSRAKVFRSRPRKPWYFKIGNSDTKRGPYRSLDSAIFNSEIAMAASLRLALRTLEAA